VPLAFGGLEDEHRGALAVLRLCGSDTGGELIAVPRKVFPADVALRALLKTPPPPKKSRTAQGQDGDQKR